MNPPSLSSDKHPGRYGMPELKTSNGSTKKEQKKRGYEEKCGNSTG